MALFSELHSVVSINIKFTLKSWPYEEKQVNRILFTGVRGSLTSFFFFCQWDHQSPSVNWKESWHKEATWLCSVSHPLAQSPLCIPGSESRRRRERMNVCLPNLRLVSHLFYWSMETTGQSVFSQWILNLVWWAPHKDLEYTTEPHCFYFSHLTGNRKICLFFP